MRKFHHDRPFGDGIHPLGKHAAVGEISYGKTKGVMENAAQGLIAVDAVDPSMHVHGIGGLQLPGQVTDGTRL